MALFKQRIDAPAADDVPFTPSANVRASTVQEAIQYVMDNATGSSGTVYAPTDAQYLVSTGSAGLSNERVMTDTALITWDDGTLGQMKANWAHLGIEDLSDPNADRIAFWDDSAGAFQWLTATAGLSIVGTNLSITNANLVDIRDATFAQGDILYFDGSDLVPLNAGSTGQFLKTQGSGADPVWANVPGGGDLLSHNNLSDVDSATTARSNLGLAIGSDVQAYDAGLASISGLTTAANKMIYTTAADTYAVADLTAFARSILDDADEATFKATVNLEIGTDVQAYDATLASLSSLGTTADRIAYTTGVDTWAETALSSFGRSLIDDSDASAARTTLGVAIGTDVQAYDAGLSDIAGLAVTDGNIIVGNGANWVAESGATARASLGLTIGTHVQAYSANLDSWSAVNESAYYNSTETDSAIATALTAYTTTADLASTANGDGAALVGIQDAGAYFSGTDVESALQYLGSAVAALDQAVVLKGSWDASAGTFPGSGSAQAGWSYVVSVDGTVDSVEFTAGDRIVAITDNASTTVYASNWLKLDYTDRVSSVAGRTGGVTLAQADISGLTTGSSPQFSALNIGHASDTTVTRVSAGVIAVEGSNVLMASNIGSTVQGYDADTAKYDDVTANFTGTLQNGGSNVVVDSDIGSTVQAHDAGLASIAGLTTAADRMIYTTASDTYAVTTLTSFARSILDDTDEATFKATVNLEIGTDVQAYDADLAAIAALTTTAAGRSVLTLTDPNADRLTFWDDSAGAMAHGTPTNGIEISNTSVQMTSNQRTGCITYVIDGGGSAITTGIKGDFSVPAGCTITSVTALADQTGSIVIDIWKDTYANFPPTDADSITSAAPVTISSATKATDSTLTGWTTSISAGDILRFNVDSASTVTRVTLEIRVTKS